MAQGMPPDSIARQGRRRIAVCCLRSKPRQSPLCLPAGAECHGGRCATRDARMAGVGRLVELALRLGGSNGKPTDEVDPCQAMKGVLQAHPEIAFFLVLGLGYLFGKIALGSFKLGAVTGTLLAGVLVGQLGVTLPNEVKQCFFLLFLFAIGFRTGPQFFRGLKSDGLPHAALAAIVATTGLVVAWVVAGCSATTRARPPACRRIAHRVGDHRHGDGRDRAAGPAGGRAHGTQQQHPGRLRGDLSGRRDGAAWVLSQLAPKLLRVDLAEECRKLEEQMQGGRPPRRPRAASSSCAPTRSIRVRGSSGAASPSSSRASGARIFVEQVRSRGQIVAARDVRRAQGRRRGRGSGPRTTLVEVLEAPGSGLREVDDRELLDVPSDVVDVVVTSQDIDGRTLADLARDEVSRGVFLRRITPGRHAPRHAARYDGASRRRADHRRHRPRSTARVAEAFGVADRATDVTDMLVVATGIVAGALIGLPALRHRRRRDRPEPAGRRAARRTGLRLAALRAAAACSVACRDRRCGSSSRSVSLASSPSSA